MVPPVGGTCGSSIPNMSRDELRAKKLTTRCYECGKLGIWGSDHSPDGSVKLGLPWLNAPEKRTLEIFQTRASSVNS